ncbi:MAG: cyclic nucleotide-binding domain-containing protein [Alphaproteobacteria bacterium]|nr:cyclic nucleotide-binding domain-containing protein [Alphaproteobacteria bacterium]
MGRTLDVSNGKRIFSQGDMLKGAFVILGGRVELTQKAGDYDETVVDILGQGDIIGVTGLIQEGKACFTARALENTTLLPITTAAFTEVLDAANPMVRNVVTALVHRLKACQTEKVKTAPIIR